MSRKVILDTRILSEFLKGHDRTVVGHAERYAKENSVFSFTSITVFEITLGLETKGATRQLQTFLTWLKRNEEIVPTAADYLIAARLKSAAGKQGAIVELPDCLIAEAAARQGWPVVTGNTKHFQAIRNTGVISLSMENWRDRDVAF